MFTIVRQKSYWLIILIPLLYTAYSWKISQGVPYFTDANESYSTYAHSRNMTQFEPSKNFLLTDDGVGLHPEAHPFTYTHQGNLPRYISYLMIKIGIKKLEYQILLGAILSIFLTYWFAWKVFHKKSDYFTCFFILSFLALDFLGVLQWYGNLFRTWHIPLFFCCLLITQSRFIQTRFFGLTFVLFFLLWQMEFVFAIFSTITVLLSIFLNRKEEYKFKKALIICCASGISVILFILQLMLFLGLEGFLYDLKITYIARNSHLITWDLIKDFYEKYNVVMWPSFETTNFGFWKFLQVTNDYFHFMYSNFIWTLALIGTFFTILISLITTLRPDWIQNRKGVRILKFFNEKISIYLYSVVVAYLLLGIFLSGYTLTAYTQRWGSISSFIVMFGFLSFIFNLKGVLYFCVRYFNLKISRKFFLSIYDTASILIGLILLAINSINTYIHPLHYEAAALLSGKYINKTFVSNTTYPHMISYYTQNWSYYCPLIFRPDETIDMTYNWNADRFINPDYNKPDYYLCQNMQAQGGVNCAEVAKNMSNLGHQIAEQGKTYAIIKLNMK